MDGNSQAIAIGLGAGLGGFVGFVIIACILWHCFCGSWCEKKKGQSAIKLVSVKDKRKPQSESRHKTQVTTVSPMNIKNASSDLQSR